MSGREQKEMTGRSTKVEPKEEELVIRAQPLSWVAVKWMQWQIITSQYILFPVENVALNCLILLVVCLMVYRLYSFFSYFLSL